MSGAVLTLIQFGSAGGSSGGGGFQASAFPSSQYASKSFPPIVSSQSLATPIGGVGPYTYAWSLVSGDSSIIPTSSTSAATTFRTLTAAGSVSAVFQCTITDSTSATAVTNGVYVTLTSTSGSGGGGTNTSR